MRATSAVLSRSARGWLSPDGRFNRGCGRKLPILTRRAAQQAARPLCAGSSYGKRSMERAANLRVDGVPFRHRRSHSPARQHVRPAIATTSAII